MNTTKHFISVQLTRDTVCDDMDAVQLRRLARGVCKEFGDGRARVTIVLVNDQTIRKLHRNFLGRTKTTDVISFDLSEPLEKTRLFDIIINVQQARRQAARLGHSVQAETALYLVHGLLHQFGYDDRTEYLARRMHRQEDRILKEAGFGQVYHSARKG